MSRRLLTKLLAFGMIWTVVVPGPVAADDLEDDLAGVADRISALAAQIDAVTAARSQLAAEIRAAGGRMERLLADVNTNEAAMSGIEGGIASQEQRLAEVTAHLADSYSGLYATQTDIAWRRASAIQSAREAYQGGRMDTAAVTVIAKRLSDVSIALVYLERAATTNEEALTTLFILEDRAVDQQIAVTAEEAVLVAEAAQMELLLSDLDIVSDELAQDRNLLVETIIELEALLAALDEELAEFSDELDGLESEQKKIKRKIADEQAKRSAPPISAAGFVRPVPGVVTSDFGPRVHPVLGYSRLHTGVDMAAGYGQRVKAAKGGTVILAGNWGGYGRTVVIDHGGGVSTLYAHLSYLSVRNGDSLSAGVIVGKVGMSGLSTGPHLHFEVRRRGDPIDPAPFLKG